MAEVDQLRPRNNMSDLERNVIHAVRMTFKAMNFYHAVWDIVIEQKSPNRLDITAWIPERITMPNGMQKPIIPIHFSHVGEPMREFTDVSYIPIARELMKEMTRAFQMGAQYKQG